MDSIRLSAIFAASLLLLQTLLALNVSLRRLVERNFKHDEVSGPLRRAQLTHRNAAEHVPLLALLLILVGGLGTPPTWVMVLGVGALVTRLLHALGYLVPSLGVLKITGATLCYGVEIAACAAIFARLGTT